jgi:hypothetical protein
MRRWIGTYILDEHGQPVPEPDTLRWAKWFETANRVVRQDRVEDIVVSTVFLGLDHNWYEGAHEPILWEAMIFGGVEDQYQRRYSSLKDAEEGHIQALMMIEPWAKDVKEFNLMMTLQ